MTALSTTTNPWVALALLAVALTIVSGYSAINAVVKAELFPVEIRALGIGLLHVLTVAVFGGTAEYIALWCRGAEHEPYFYWYIAGCIVISLLLFLALPETRTASCLDEEQAG